MEDNLGYGIACVNGDTLYRRGTTVLVWERVREHSEPPKEYVLEQSIRIRPEQKIITLRLIRTDAMEPAREYTFIVSSVGPRKSLFLQRAGMVLLPDLHACRYAVN